MTIGERIKKLREEKNITVDKLAELIGRTELQYTDMKAARLKSYQQAY